MLSMKKYVGTAKSLPLSFTPRRLPYMTITMNASEMGTRIGLSPSNEEMSAAVPADTDTDTVRM